MLSAAPPATTAAARSGPTVALRARRSAASSTAASAPRSARLACPRLLPAHPYSIQCMAACQPDLLSTWCTHTAIEREPLQPCSNARRPEPPHYRAAQVCQTGFFCPRTRGGTQSWDPGTRSCVEATECSIDPLELPPGVALGRSAPPPYPQCSDLLYEVHRSHRWKVHRNHRDGVPWYPLP